MTDDVSHEINKLWLAVEALASAIIAQQGVLVPIVLGAKLESMFPEADHIKMTGAFNEATRAIDAFLEVSGSRHRSDENLAAILAVLQHISAPRRLIRDKSGQVTGIETIEK